MREFVCTLALALPLAGQSAAQPGAAQPVETKSGVQPGAGQAGATQQWLVEYSSLC